MGVTPLRYFLVAALRAFRLAYAATAALETLLLIAAAVTVAGFQARIQRPAKRDQPYDHHRCNSQRNQNDGNYDTHQPSPAKPIKLIDSMPATISAAAVPLTSAGTLARSSFSRIPAINTSANANPAPAPSA